MKLQSMQVKTITKTQSNISKAIIYIFPALRQTNQNCK